MDYETVELQERILVGVSARTSNNDPRIGEIIGGVWNRLYSSVIGGIGNKVSDCTIGLYSDYESDEKGEYTITAGCQVSSDADIPEGTTVKRIAAGKYARFTIQESKRSDAMTAIQAFWAKLWTMPLSRAFVSDFEEYLPEADGSDVVVHIYIGLKA